MKLNLSIPLAALAAGLLFAPAVGHAANWRQPYSNVDRRTDAGNDTGDAQVPALNEAQLDRNYHGSWYYPNGTDNPPAAPPPGTMMVMPAPAPGQYVPPR